MKAVAYKNVGWKNHTRRIGNGGRVLSYEIVAFDYYVVKTEDNQEILVRLNSNKEDESYPCTYQDVDAHTFDYFNKEATYISIRSESQQFWDEVISWSYDEQGFLEKRVQ